MTKVIQNINVKELSSAISQICEEKGLDKKKVMSIVEDALAAAYKKDYGHKGQIIQAKFDPESQTASFYQIKEVVDETLRNMEEIEDEEPSVPESYSDKDELPRFNKERDIILKEAREIKEEAKLGDEIKIKLPTKNKFGRVAAQNAKQVIIQKLREAERETLYEEFKNKEDEVVTATVQRVENRNVFLDLGKTTGILFPSDQVENENYRVGQRLKLYVEKVDKDAKDTTVILSRSNPRLVSKLFSLEVPEIFAGTVTIESIAREPGSRTKIAVKSQEEGIDPIGACVGQKGIRVQAIIDELGGEKIDIIEYIEDPKSFISHALSPAKVRYVEINEKESLARATVDQDQLSLAIGKRGQNVRLAAKLSGWKIDVVSEEEAKREEGETTTKEESEEEPKATPAKEPRAVPEKEIKEKREDKPSKESEEKGKAE